MTPVVRMLDRWSAGWRPYAALVLLCLCLYLPGMAGLPPFDRDEARFVQATRQMIDSGDYVEIRFQDEARNKKPVGIHWLQAASVGALSSAESRDLRPYRLVSVLGVTGAVLLTFALGAVLFDRRTALLGAALTAASLIAVVEAHLAKSDAALVAAALAAELGLARLYVAARSGAPPPAGAALLLWAGIGIAGLIKGPVVPAIVGLAVLALWIADRRAGAAGWLPALRAHWGVPLALAIVAPWLILVSTATGGAFVGDAVRSDLLPKLIGGQESHGAPPGYYLLLLAVTLWPAALAVPQGLLAAWRGRAAPAMRLALAWIVPAWLMFEAVPTKLPHYVLPLYPTLALLSADALLAGSAAGRWRWAAVAWRLVWAGIAVALGAGALAAAIVLGGDVVATAAGALALCAGLATAALGLRRQADPPRAAMVGIAGAVALFALILGLVMPRLDPLWVSRQAVALIAREAPASFADDGWRIAVVGYSEPSFVFLAGTRVRFPDAAGAAAHLAATPDGIALIGDRDLARFRAAAAAAALQTVEGGKAAGFNYSRGRRVTLTLFRRR
ncbi:MAG: ArnT family glycosyltransferase [Alphaproteobacteria bacterium]